MKKATFGIILLCIFSLSSINAQTDQGKFLLGSSTSIGFWGSSNEFMNIGFTSTKSKSDNYTDDDADKQINLNLQPKFGYFATDNLAVGLDLIVYFSHYKSGGTDSKTNSTLLLAGPFVKYYIPAGSVKPFFEASGAMGGIFSKYEYSGDEEKDKSRAISTTARAGIAIPIGEVVLFETSIFYNYMNLKDTEDNDENYREIYNTFGVNIGFIILL